ncbi:hypothetical protein [Bacillus weihaiensis]|uniref:Uncharacterized protein n=1 Tax=Bacillus weihaiensis TaxID=1547283 RepID=A0A1L3MWY1_9BACI|nr:hypothetical protein [Bacillus weihaiensis]APH06828.1 hypothetical protein A9C19_20330 [Bacillus weihaiensis]
MKDGQEYLLFLTPEQDGLFGTRGVTFGKVPLNTEELEVSEDQIESSHTHTEKLRTIFNEGRKKYGK